MYKVSAEKGVCTLRVAGQEVLTIVENSPVGLTEERFNIFKDVIDSQGDRLKVETKDVSTAVEVPEVEEAVDAIVIEGVPVEDKEPTLVEKVTGKRGRKKK